MQSVHERTQSSLFTTLKHKLGNLEDLTQLKETCPFVSCFLISVGVWHHWMDAACFIYSSPAVPPQFLIRANGFGSSCLLVRALTCAHTYVQPSFLSAVVQAQVSMRISAVVLERPRKAGGDKGRTAIKPSASLSVSTDTHQHTFTNQCPDLDTIVWPLKWSLQAGRLDA